MKRTNFLLGAVLTATAISFVAIPLFGHLSDRLGRKRVYMFGAAVTASPERADISRANSSAAAGSRSQA